MTAIKGYEAGRSGISGNILCGREHLANLDDSSMEEVKQAIRSVDWLERYYDIGEKYIRSRDGRIKYIFTGLRHNIGGVKSKARILVAWVDEAEQVAETAWRTLLPTVRENNSEIWITWNPESPDSSTHTRFRENPPDNSKIVELNYMDNPWFPAELEEERREDEAKRPETYGHIWEGAFHTITDALIFKDRFTKAEFEPTPEWHGPYFGLDFGFANDPTASVECYIHDNNLYIRRESGKKKLKLDHTVGHLTAAHPRIGMHTVRADNARPESIAYLRDHGIPRTIGVKKGQGSVHDGIEHIKSYDQVIIHPDCPNVYSEFMKYSFKVDRLSGDIMPIPVDAFNHWIDATRYALEPLMRIKSAPRIRLL